jgi:uncharacterized protein with HEPN domain
VSRSDAERLDDVLTAIATIRGHLEHGPLSIEIVLDTVCMRLLEIGEAVKGLSPVLLASEPDVDWGEPPACATFLLTGTSRRDPRSSS